MGQKEATNEEISDLLVPGRPFNVWVIPAEAIEILIQTKTFEEVSGEEYRGVRLAFCMWDQIRLGEIKTWHCCLCEREGSGLAKLVCFGVADRADTPPTDDKPALVNAICDVCSIDGQEVTEALYERRIGVLRIEEGHA
jgi:hypothetical protein